MCSHIALIGQRHVRLLPHIFMVPYMSYFFPRPPCIHIFSIRVLYKSTMFAIDVLHFFRDVLCLPVGVACFSICSYDFLRESRVSVYVSTFPLYFLSAPLYISEARPSCFTFCNVFPIYFLCIFYVTVYNSILSYISHTFLRGRIAVGACVTLRQLYEPYKKLCGTIQELLEM